MAAVDKPNANTMASKESDFFIKVSIRVKQIDRARRLRSFGAVAAGNNQTGTQDKLAEYSEKADK
jgi:hypothetical protein